MNKEENNFQELIMRANEEGKSVNLSFFIEITEDLELDKVVWYYNNIKSKRFEIERMYFDRFKTYQEWYEVYKLSKAKDVSREMALEHIQKLIKDIDDILEIYDVDFSDEVMRKITFDKILEVTPDEFDKWLHIYDETIFDKKLNSTAMKKCIQFAKEKDHWQKIYDRSDIGSAIQLKAIQNLYGRIELSEEEKKHVDSQESRISYKSQSEYNQEYEKERFGSNKQLNTLVNKYLAADDAAGKTGGEE